MLCALANVGAFAQFAGAKFDGNWLGTLDAGGVKLRVALHLDKGADGKLTGKLDSLDQGARGIPITDIKVEGQRITMTVPAVKGNYEAKLSPDGKELDGTWTQGAPLPLKMTRVDSIPTARRTQVPMAPFPYEERQVAVDAKVLLGGTLTVPKGGGPYPAVVLLSGSGAQDRDETLMEHKPFQVIADHLSRNGIAVLRLDDRGVGKSGGNLNTSTLVDLAEDAVAAVKFLKAQPGIDGAHVGLMGHSEGGIVAPMAANRSKGIAFVVLLAGTGVPGEQIVYEQSRLIAKAMGAGDHKLGEQKAKMDKIFSALREEPDPGKLKARLGSDADNPMVAALSTPNSRYMMSFDPAPELRKLSVPVLALFGSKDMQVPPKQSLGPMASALAESGDPDFTIAVLPGLNHLFQTAPTGSPMEYATIEETFAPAALDVVTTWLRKHSR